MSEHDKSDYDDVFEQPKTTLKNCNCWACVQKKPFESEDVHHSPKFFISRNLYYQRKSDKDIRRLTENIQKMKPNWDSNFIKNYIISRYPDYYFYNKKLKERYHNLSRPLRERFRINVISEEHLCDDVIEYIRLFV